MSAGRRRGRPPGSVSLTPEIHEAIVNLILAGAYDYAAAEAAGVSDRTFRDWMARGEGTQPTRPPTPKLRRFARDVIQARAQARVAAEAIVHERDPKYWLSRVARTKPKREGWTDPRAHEDVQEGPRLEDRIQARRLREAEEAAQAAAAECPDPNCPCPRHQSRDKG